MENKNKNINEMLKEAVEKKVNDYNWYLIYLQLRIEELQMKKTIVSEDLEAYREFLRHLRE